MKLFSVKRMSLAAAVFTFGAFGSVEWSNNYGPSVGFIRGDFPVVISTANAAGTSRVPRHTSCTLVRYYVAKYTAAAAEAWALHCPGSLDGTAFGAPKLAAASKCSSSALVPVRAV